jgi:hypothetical protein
MPIDVKDRSKVLSSLWLWLPQSSRKAGQSFCEENICSNAGQFSQKSLGVAVAVGPMPIGQQRQSLTGVATKIPGSSQSHGFQKE